MFKYISCVLCMTLHYRFNITVQERNTHGGVSKIEKARGLQTGFFM